MTKTLAGAAVTFLGCGGAAVSGRPVDAVGVPRPRQSPAPAGIAARTRHVVVLVLAGGYDTILTFDPRIASAVHDRIDCGYTPDERVRGERRLFGPMIGDLARHDASMCLVHGVRVDTVAHDTALGILANGGRYSEAPLGYSLAASLPGEGIPYLLVQADPRGANGFQSEFTVDSLTARSTLERPSAGSALPAWADLALDAEAEEARVILAGAPELATAQGDARRHALNMNRLLSDAPRTTRFKDTQLAPSLELALHALRHDLAKVVVVTGRTLWLDSHTDNQRIQGERVRPALDDVARFLDALASEQTEHGSLLSQTTVVVCSELGRYPRLNAARGKDHWPETTWALFGSGVRGGTTIGATDDRLRGARVDYRTGLAGGDSARPIFVENIAATLLKIAGGSPSLVGVGEADVLSAALAI